LLKADVGQTKIDQSYSQNAKEITKIGWRCQTNPVFERQQDQQRCHKPHEKSGTLWEIFREHSERRV